MYSLVQRVSVTPGRQAEYDAISEEFLAYAKTVPGMLSIVQLQSLSNPQVFDLAMNLQNRAAALAWARSPELGASLQQMAPGVFTVAGEVQGWQSVAVSGSPSKPGYGFTVLQRIKSDSGVQQGFEEAMRGVIAQFERHAHGMQTAMLTRLAGGVTSYVFYCQFDRPADCTATLSEPAIAQLGIDNPAAPYLATPFEIVVADVVRVAVSVAAAVAR